MSSALADLRDYRTQAKSLHWKGTFADYLEIVKKYPDVAQLAHARIYNMIKNTGSTKNPDGTTSYHFFRGELFGIDRALEEIVDYFKSAAHKLDVRKRILLLMGPVSGGKSTIVEVLKRGLERFSRTDEGALYAISGCPMREEPLHLIPPHLRKKFEEEYGVTIEGDLCPVCNLRLKEEWDYDIFAVPVERAVFSEKDRMGIGTFLPSDPKSQDVSELVGSIDFSTIGEYGSESDPRAYRFDGELNVANRGLMEFVEMLKADEKFLYGLLTLSQEQRIKTGRYAMIYADEVVISHTNETEYKAFTANKKNEALQDRIITVKVPYNLKLSEEVKIYKKLLRQANIKNVHIAPHTLETASMFAILTRLEESKKKDLTLMKKLKLYDGQEVEGFNEKDLREIKEEATREGMDGISPRYVINRISHALVKEDKECINALDCLRALKDGLDQHPSITPEQREKYKDFIYQAREEFDEWAKTEIQKAFVYSFEENARTLLQNYLDNVEAFVEGKTLRDPVTGEEMKADERLMRAIEEQIGVSETQKKDFRNEIMIAIGTMARKGKEFDYKSHEGLKTAIEKKLFTDLKDVVKITTSTRTPDEEQLKKINEVADRLIQNHGFCKHCANEILRYVGNLLNR